MHSTHENLERGAEVRMSSDRAFGLVMAAACGLIGFWPLLHRKPVRWVPIALCAGFLLLGLLRPSILHPLNRLWTVLAVALNRVTNPIVCGLLFFLVITPVAWVMRLRGKDPLRLRPDPDSKTYWIERPPGPDAESMRLQF
jgi:hypothetical protein